MFKRVWWQGFRSAQSDEGYQVRLFGLRRGLQYSEGDHVLRVNIELSVSGNIIYIDSVKGGCLRIKTKRLAKRRDAKSNRGSSQR
jgi:hypothetical protein